MCTLFSNTFYFSFALAPLLKKWQSNSHQTHTSLKVIAKIRSKLKQFTDRL